MTDVAHSLDGAELLPTRIKRLLIEQIVSGELGPGERIVESRLAKDLGTSQSPVREALRDLASIGLVEMSPRRGSRVRSPDAKELSDVSLLRSTLDAFAAELAADRITPEGIAALGDLLNDMKAAAHQGNMSSFATADAMFHRVIAQASDNGPLQRVLEQLEPFGRTYVTVLLPDTDLDEIVIDHDAILAALKTGNASASGSAARYHQLRVAKFVGEKPDAESGEPA